MAATITVAAFYTITRDTTLRARDHQAWRCGWLANLPGSAAAARHGPARAAHPAGLQPPHTA